MTAQALRARAPSGSEPAPVVRADQPKIPHRPELDGLRGLAVVGVLLYHGGHLRGGYLGVDLFFVLSGYLITALLLAEVGATGGIELGRFWLRRARRLLPALFALLVAIAVFGRFLAAPLQWPAIRGDGLATLFYVANWHTILGGMPYGAATIGQSPLEHTWSLAIEEQFYIVWPLVVAGVLAIRRSPQMVLGAALAVAGIGTALMIGLSFTSISQNALYLGTDTRMAAIGFGAVLASWQVMRAGRPLSPAAGQILDSAAVVSAVLLLFAWSTIGLHDTFLYRGGFTLCGLAVALIIWSVTRERPTPLGRLLSVPPLRGLGFISYGLYLWHLPIFLWLDARRTGLHGWTLFGVQCAASLAVAVMSYEYIEQPIRRSQWPVLRTASMAGVAAVVATAALVLLAVGAPINPLAGASSKPIQTIAHAGLPRVAIYGDSVGYFWGRDGAVARATALRVSVDDEARIGCEPLGGVTQAIDGHGVPVWSKSWTNCIDSTTDELPTYPKHLHDRPDVALVFFGGVQWDAKIGGSFASPCDPSYQRLYLQRMEKVVAEVGAAGTAVVVVRPAPIIDPSVTDATGLSDGAERADCAWHAIEPVLLRRGVSTVDLQSHFCSDSNHCDGWGGDHANRSDGIHYTGLAARSLANWLIPAALHAAGR